VSVREKDNPALFAKVKRENLLRQYDLLSNCIEIGIEKGIESFDKYTLWALNYAAVAKYCPIWSRYREEPIYVGIIFLHISRTFRIKWIASFLWSMKTGRSLITQQFFPLTLYGD